MKKHKKKVLQTNLDIAVLIPARNEPTIGETIWSIKRQTVKPGCVVIVLNNCTDNGETKRLAKKACKRFQLNYKILEMKNNPHMKAGALNFGFDWIGGNLPAVKYIVQMDADSQLGVNFIERTAEALDKEVNAEIGALSCAFTGKSGLATNRREAVIMWHQRLEYVRYHDSGIQKNVNVLSGTGSTFRVSALNRLHNARGYVWDVSSLVEDYELTLALRLAGWQTRKALKF